MNMSGVGGGSAAGGMAGCSSSSNSAKSKVNANANSRALPVDKPQAAVSAGNVGRKVDITV